MRIGYLIRFKETDEGTEGILAVTGFFCFTLELPWRDNKRNISCIPVGDYTAIPYSGHKFKKAYYITNVPNRSYILIHSGNFAGDINKDYKTDTKGCILVGERFGYLNNQRAVLSSRKTLRALITALNHEPFILKIRSLVRSAHG